MTTLPKINLEDILKQSADIVGVKNDSTITMDKLGFFVGYAGMVLLFAYKFDSLAGAWVGNNFVRGLIGFCLGWMVERTISGTCMNLFAAKNNAKFRDIFIQCVITLIGYTVAIYLIIGYPLGVFGLFSITMYLNDGNKKYMEQFDKVDIIKDVISTSTKADAEAKAVLIKAEAEAKAVLLAEQSRADQARAEQSRADESNRAEQARKTRLQEARIAKQKAEREAAQIAQIAPVAPKVNGRRVPKENKTKATEGDPVSYACKFAHLGCGEVGRSPQSLNSHYAKCDFNPVNN